LRDFSGRFASIDNLSAIHAYMGNGQQARAYALAALRLASDGKSAAYEAPALENLAEAESVIGDYPAAISTMLAALAKRREIGSAVCVGWDLAHLSVWYARLGDLQSARTHIATMLASEDTIRIGNAWPQYCYWAAAQIYRLSGDAVDADRLLDRASELMMEQARNCPTPERRDAFMALTWHRDIAAARHSGIWPEL
jgi:tetratricopeptide (TPR) repeat protein